MKRLLAALLLLTACAPEPAPFPPGPTHAVAAPIPEGRTPQERRALFQSALALYQRGDQLGAEPLFTRVAAIYPELSDYGHRYLATIAETRGDQARALATWQALRDRFPDSIWRGEAHLAIGRAFITANDWRAAANELGAARGSLKEATARAAALGLTRQAAIQLGNDAEARSAASELRSKFARSPEALAAREDAWANRESVALASPASAREEIALLTSEGEGARAVELARIAQSRFRSDAELPELLWLEASALTKTGDREAAAAVLERLRARYPRHPAAAKALYRQAAGAWNRDEDETALELYARYLSAFPRGEQAAEAIYATARIHQEARRFEVASREFARMARLYPKHTLASEARFRIAWCKYRGGDLAGAARAFQEIADLGNDERPSALYWKARMSDDASTYATLLAEYPESYYATLAERRLARPPGSALNERTPAGMAASSSASAVACGTSDLHLARFGELKAMNLASFARDELAAYQERVSGCDGFLVTAWSEVGGYRQAVGRAQRAAGCGLESPWIRYCYPLAYWQLIQSQTSARSLDPYLVASLIRQESLFDAEIRSSANAVGLMQILPSTGSGLASRHGIGGFDASQLVDPTTNVTLGTAYLRELLDRYGGNLPRALAAYNAGENAVDKWQRRYPDLEDDEFVESISYRETRGYVKRVLQNRRIYGSLYPTSPSS